MTKNARNHTPSSSIASAAEKSKSNSKSKRRGAVHEVSQDGGSATAEAILRAAINEFADHGFDAVSVRNIAQKTGANLSSVYFHFKDKRDLYLRACVRAVDEGNVGPSTALRSDLPAPERLQATIAAVASAALNHDKMLKLVSRELLEADGEGLKLIADRVMHEGFDLMLRTIQEATGKPATMRNVVAIYALTTATVQFSAFGGAIAEDLRPLISSPDALARHIMNLLFPEVAARLAPRSAPP